MFKDVSLSAIVAGTIAVVVSYAGPSLIVLQAANAANLSEPQIASWILAISIGSGVSAVLLSIWSKAPIITAWSTPGAALLVTSLPSYPYAQAIGAFLVAAALITLLGVTGLFEQLVSKLPKSIAAAMLAGILFRFGSQIFTSFSAQPLLVGLMFAAYLLMKRVWPRYAIAAVLLLGIAVSAFSGLMHFQSLHVQLALPLFTMPEFSLSAIVGLGLPLALVTLTGQYVPGVAVLKTSGYETRTSPLVWGTSIFSLLLAPFGSHGINLAAITAAICSGPEANLDPRKRYVAGVALGVLYIAVGLFGATLVSLFVALPKELVAAVAGLALLGAIMNGMASAMAVEHEREPALITFLVTASGTSFLGIGSAFWGLAVGLIATAILASRSTLAATNPVVLPTAKASSR